jgi:N-glycosylase/DNA lyase
MRQYNILEFIREFQRFEEDPKTNQQLQRSRRLQRLCRLAIALVDRTPQVRKEAAEAFLADIARATATAASKSTVVRDVPHSNSNDNNIKMMDNNINVQKKQQSMENVAN